MVSLSDNSIFSGILAHPEVATIWSDTHRTNCYLKFESALAKVQAQLKIIPQDAADLIVSACGNPSSFIDYQDLKTQTERIGYPVLPVVKQIVNHVNELRPGQALGEWAHYGATTQDITDTACIMQLRETLIIVDDILSGIIAALRKLAEEHKSTPMAARSNLQQAVPMSVGFKFSRLLSTFLRHRARLVELKSRLLVLEFSGAAGTLASLSPDGSDNIGFKCQELLATELDLKVPDIAWHTERDCIAEYGFFLCLVTQTCAKFAYDLKLEMQTEVGEMKEGYVPHRGSSSTMPQKRNPIGCVYVTALAATVRQLSANLSESMTGDHERSTGNWEIEWIVLPQISAQAAATLKHTKDILEGLEIYPKVMDRNLAISRGAIVSEHVMMNLAQRMGRQKAHDLVYDLCREASESDRQLLDLLIEDKEISAVASKEDVEKLCDPANYLGLSMKMTERVLKNEQNLR